MTTLQITAFTPADWPDVWSLLAPVFAAGDAYPCPVDISEAAARAYWIESPTQTFVAREAGDVVGTYYIRPDQPGLGDHICNCGYAVAEAARGRGLARAMQAHSEAEARRRGFLGMRYNLVVATNTAAVRAWTRAGFDIVGTVPKAFRHRTLGFVDAHIMFKRIDGGTS